MNTSNILRQFPLLNVLNMEQIKEMEHLVEMEVFPRHSYIYLKGESADTIFFLFRGNVKIGRFASDGRGVIKAIKHAFSIFGEAALASADVHSDFAVAMNKEVQLFKIKRQDFNKIMLKYPALWQEVLLLLGNRLQETEKRLEALVFKDARERIIDFLRENVESIGKQAGMERYFKHALTQQDIAYLTGTSRQTVTMVLNDLRKSNLIYFNRNTFLIRDIEKLS